MEVTQRHLSSTVRKSIRTKLLPNYIDELFIPLALFSIFKLFFFFCKAALCGGITFRYASGINSEQKLFHSIATFTLVRYECVEIV